MPPGCSALPELNCKGCAAVASVRREVLADVKAAFEDTDLDESGALNQMEFAQARSDPLPPPRPCVMRSFCRRQNSTAKGSSAQDQVLLVELK